MRLEARVDEVRGWRRARAAVPAYSKSPVPVGHREAHLASAGVATPSSSSRRVEVRVVAVVEDDEAGVDASGSRRRVSTRDRVRVAADARVGLEDDDLVLAGCSRCAATSPEIPAPTIAILITDTYVPMAALDQTPRPPYPAVLALEAQALAVLGLRWRRSFEKRPSRRIRLAALWPGAPMTPPPGWVPAPQR